jgi:hypothetical protein
VTVQIVLGGVVILIGVALVVSTERRAKRRPAPAPADEVTAPQNA